MRKSLTLLTAAALALGLAGASMAKDMGPPYTMNDKLHRCTDAKGAMVATAKCSAPAATAAAKPKNCKKGKPCGNSCIAVSDTCHIPAK